jgi:hypothetical protein
MSETLSIPQGMWRGQPDERLIIGLIRSEMP